MRQQPNRTGRAIVAAWVCACGGLIGVLAASSTADGDDAGATGSTITLDRAEVEAVLAEHAALREEVAVLRETVARRDLEVASLQRKHDELKQFIADHDAYGDAYEKYQSNRVEKDRARRMETQRERLAQRQEQRQARADTVRQRMMQREIEDAARKHDRELADAGFNPVGDDVYVARMGFSYLERLIPGDRSVYIPYYTYYSGGFYNSWDPGYRWDVDRRLDFSYMTTSGSVLNTSQEIRNIGIAITFYDEFGNQVGGDTVEIENVRPYAPVPFTKELNIALRRPFASSNVYLLYSDPVNATPAP